MEGIEAREQDLIQHIRTAGLQKRREICLVDEVLELRKERRKFLTSMQSQIASLTSERSELTERCGQVISDAKEQLLAIKVHFEEKLKSVQTDLEARNKELMTESNALLDQNNKLKDHQLTMTQKYSKNVGLLDAKIKELVKIQRVTESTLRQDIEASVSRRIADELELKHEGEKMK
jgi:hypothetical protein